MQKLKTVSIGRTKFVIVVQNSEFWIKSFILIFFVYIGGLIIHYLITKPEEFKNFIDTYNKHILLFLGTTFIVCGIFMIKIVLKKTK